MVNKITPSCCSVQQTTNMNWLSLRTALVYLLIGYTSEYGWKTAHVNNILLLVAMPPEANVAGPSE